MWWQWQLDRVATGVWAQLVRPYPPWKGGAAVTWQAGVVQAWSPRPQQPAVELKIYVYELPFVMSQLQVCCGTRYGLTYTYPA